MSRFPDLLGEFIRWTPGFRGKRRLVQSWMQGRDRGSQRIRSLPGGARVLCDLQVPYEAMVWLRQEEQSDLAVLQALLRPGDVFVDCGANIGIWTLSAAAKLASTGQIFAFEPSPPTHSKLKKNVRELNQISDERVRLFPRALGNSIDQLPFQAEEEHNISHLTSGYSDKSILVQVVTLDSVLERAPVTGIKIDVEGFELAVLQGAEVTLKRCQPWLCVEFNTVLAKVNRLGNWDVHRHLSERGYHCCLFGEAARRPDRSLLSDDWQTNGYCNLFYWVA